MIFFKEYVCNLSYLLYFSKQFTFLQMFTKSNFRGPDHPFYESYRTWLWCFCWCSLPSLCHGVYGLHLQCRKCDLWTLDVFPGLPKPVFHKRIQVPCKLQIKLFVNELLFSGENDSTHFMHSLYILISSHDKHFPSQTPKHKL